MHINKSKQQQHRQQLLEEIHDADGETVTTITATDAEDSSCSSYSLQECIDELNARRIRHFSTQSREPITLDPQQQQQQQDKNDEEDLNLINQNLHNKEHERKCKPCKNGFCYCFTSDSCDSAANPAVHPQHHRRGRKSEPTATTTTTTAKTVSAPQPNLTSSKLRHSGGGDFVPHKKCQAPVAMSPIKRKQHQQKQHNPDIQQQKTQLTAISRLEAASSQNAPLVHIIQELHNNCVISEVRVNRHKISGQGARSLNASPQKPKSTTKTARAITSLAATNNSTSELQRSSSTPEGFMYSTSLESSVRSSEGRRARNKSAGRLLQKRLAQLPMAYRPRTLNQAPPKPPRTLTVTGSLSTLNSSTPSVKAANEILDEFLRKRGVFVNQNNDKNNNTKRQATSKDFSEACTQTPKEMEDVPKSKRTHRKSFPLTSSRTSAMDSRPLPSCPSLSDLERVVIGTQKTRDKNYEKNLKNSNNQHSNSNDKAAIKELRLGWTEPKIAEMLLESSGKQFRSQACQAQPQHAMGWQVPENPKMNIDTVDGVVVDNLAINIGNKKTPIKTTIAGQSPWRKSNLKCSQFSRDLLRKSKKKILRLVSPKKPNSDKSVAAPLIVQHRNVAVQTSPHDLRNFRSPPGSYHSPMCQSTSSPPLTSPDEHFDFSRTVRSPPRTKKATRKLNFPKTYRSFQTDIEQDVSLSKMGYLLGNIRAKLEASDEHAARTFQEVERREQQNLSSFDVVDGPMQNNRHSGCLLRETSAEIHNNVVELYQRAATAPPLTPEQQQQHRQTDLNEPIYSEIEEESLIVKGSPQQENKTGIQHFFSTQDPTAIYAQVNKHSKTRILTPPKQTNQYLDTSKPMALGQFLQNSIKNLSPISEAPSSSLATNSHTNYETERRTLAAPLASSETTSSVAESRHSLNNIRMMEHESPPRVNRNLSKSDLSLQHNDMFLENFCNSEIHLETDNKINNLEQSFASTSVSYEMPDNDLSYESEGQLLSPHNNNQSTPKKLDNRSMSPEVFMTKTYMTARTQRLLELHATDAPSYSATPLPSATHSLDSTLGHCKRITNVLRRSFRKSCNLVKGETKKLSKSLNIPTSKFCAKSPTANLKTPRASSSWDDDDTFVTAGEGSLAFNSSFNLETLFALDNAAPVSEQIAQAVSICRQLPVLEVSAEMVEAERLLLFSKLRERQKIAHGVLHMRNKSLAIRRIYIDELHLPVRENPSQDMFFNYFYIVTFVCGNRIHSTQSAECHEQEAIFKDCGIEFNCSGHQEDGEWSEVRCEIFMLRLRKVSTLSLEPRKTPIVKLATTSDRTSGGSSGSNEIISRFRLHASFTLQPRDLVPYEFVEHETHRSNTICMRTSKTCRLPLKSLSKSNNLGACIQVQMRVEARFPKHLHMGLLNVQEPLSAHNWNQRWCILDGLHLSVWRDENDIEKMPLLLVDLRHSVGPHMSLPLTESPRELCARQRSFSLQAVHERESISLVPIYFAAETQRELVEWLKHLNATLQLIETWLT